MKTILKLMLIFSIAVCSFAEQDISIYLPREIAIEEGRMSLGTISILDADDRIESNIEGILMGELTIPGQKVKIDRNTILSRLASYDIDKDSVYFSGAEYVEVKLKAAKIDKEFIVNKAEKFLGQSLRNRQDIGWELANRAEDVILEGNVEGIDIKVGLDEYGNTTRSRIVVVKVFRGGKVIAEQKLQFLLNYKSSQIVAKEFIAQGALITEENIECREILTNNPAEVLKKPPYGLAAKRDIYPGQVIRNGSFGSPRPEKLVKRNQSVIVRLETLGLLLTVQGEVMQDGYVGDLVKVKVKVTEQEKIIITKVLENGDVEPVM